MKTVSAVKWIAALTLAAGLTASAQQGPGPGGQCPQGGPQGMGPGQQGGPGGGNFQPPPPAEIAKRMLEQFDADKDGKLSADELVKSIEARHQQRGPGGQQGMGPGQQGGMQRGMQGGPGGQQGFGPGPQGHQQGAGPGGQQGGPQGMGPGGQGGGQGMRPQPEQVTSRWMEQFDADRNGSLSPQELQKALEANRPPQPPQGGFGGQQGGPRGFGPPPGGE